MYGTIATNSGQDTTIAGMNPSYSPDGADQGYFPDYSSLDLVTVITQPLPPAANSNERRRLMGAHGSAADSGAAVTHRRSLLQQSNNNHIVIAPVTIPFFFESGDSDGFLYFQYDNFTGTPDYADLSYFEYDGYGTASVDITWTIFTVSGSGVGSNCVSSSANPNNTVCPPSNSFSFQLHYQGPNAQYTDGYNLTLNFGQASGPYQSSATEIYQLKYIYPPLIINADGTDGNGDRRRRLQQVWYLWALIPCLQSEHEVDSPHITASIWSSCWFRGCSDCCSTSRQACHHLLSPLLQVSSHLLSSEAPAPSSVLGSTVTISSTNQTIVGDPNNGTLVSNQTTAGQLINSTTEV